MVISIITWLYLFLIPLPYGWGISKIITNIHGEPNNKSDLSILWLSGLAVITTLSSLFSLFLSIGLIVHLIILIGAIILGHFWQKSIGFNKIQVNLKSIHWLVWVFGTLLFISTLEIATRVPSNPDSGLYHAQMIRWIETYPVIPGLGNLHTRFAFNSSWFVSNALFSFAFFGGQSFHLLPSAFFGIVLFVGLQGLQQLLNKGFSYTNFFRLLLIPISFYTLASEVSSPGTDLPVTLITWILIGKSIEIIESKERPDPIDVVIFTLISLYAITIKLSAAPLFLFAVWALITSKSITKPIIIFSSGIAGLFVILPWLIRNVVISGYLIYPFPVIDLFTIDWKIPYEIAINDQIIIQSWGRIPGQHTTTVALMTFSQWVVIWYENLTKFRKIIIDIIMLSPIIFLIFYFFPIRTFISFKNYISNYMPIITIIYCGLCFWFFGAPDFRFGYGLLLSAIVLVALPFVNLVYILFKKWSKVITLIVAFGVIGFQILFLGQSFEASSIISRLLIPADYKSLPTIPCDMNDFSILQPDINSWSECWYEPFPCTPICETSIEMRGDSLQDGFRWGSN